MSIFHFKKIKNLCLIIVLCIFNNKLEAQISNGIFFQAVARDNYANPAKDRKIYIQSSIIQKTTTGIKVLTEEHQANTDVSGVFSITLGNGIRVGGTAKNLSNIEWSNGPFYLNLKVAITPISVTNSWDYTKEWVDMGTTSFGAVPFALYSASAGGVDDKLNIADTITLSNRINLKASLIDLKNLTSSVNSNTASITSNLLNINSNTSSITAAFNAIQLKLDANKIGVANGVASLNMNGLIPNNQIPAISFQSVTVVTSESAMLALNNLVVGSIAIRSDNSKNFVLSALPASTLGNWIELASPASVKSVNGNIGPSVNLVVADIPGAEAVANKSIASDLGNSNPSDILYPTQKAVKNYVDAQNASAGVADASITSVKIGGSIAVNKGGTGATTAADARTNLGLVIGTNVQGVLTAGTDYVTPTGSAANLTNFPILNQNTTGNAATASFATTAGNITATSNATLTSLTNLNSVGAITSGIWSATTIDIEHGGTGSNAKNFVDLSSNQNSIGGTKTFLNNIVSNGVNIGKGNGVNTSSIIIGPWTNAGENSIAIGSGTMTGNSGAFNIAIGENALRDSGPVSYNTAVGFNAGANSNLGAKNTFIGYNAIATTNVSISNSTALGADALVNASNTIQLGANGTNGTTAIQNVKTSGTLTSGTVTYPNIDGTNGQILSTTGSGTLTWTTISTTAIGAAPLNANLNDQTGTTYSLVASDNGKVITLNNASAITLTVPVGLAAGFNCMIVQKGVGIVTISPTSPVTVTNRGGGTKTAGQNAIVTIISIESNKFITGGDMQ